MKKTAKGMLRTLATRGVIAAIPVAMVSAYASGIFVQPPRLAALDYLPVAEIVNSPSTIGVAESPLYGMSQQEINDQLDDLLAVGVTSIRVFVPWGLVEQSPGAYDWTYIDRVMTAAAARDMGVMAEINATPTWAGPNPGQPGFPLGSDTPNPVAFASFLQQFVNKYKTTVSAYEIWNEPNYVQFSNPIDPEAYAQLLMAAYPIIKNVVTGDPTATVVAGAVGATQDGPFTMNPVTFVQQMLAAGAGNYFDALSFHPYSNEIPFSGTCPTCQANMLTPREQLDQIKALIGVGKTIWISEYGVSTPNGEEDYAQQSAWIKDLLDYWQTYSQAGPIFLYTGQDTGTASTDPEDHYGLWEQDGTPKDVVAMLQAWITAHQPVDPTDPTDPGTPPVANPLAAVFQAIAAQLQAFVNAIVAAIQNFFAAFNPAPAAAATQSVALRIASVESPGTASLDAEPAAASTGDAKTAPSETTGADASVATVTNGTATDQVAAEAPAEEASAATPESVTAPVESTPATTTPAAPVAETVTPVDAATPTETTTTVPTTGTSTSETSGNAAGSGQTSAPSKDSSTGDKTTDKATDKAKDKDKDKSGDSGAAGKAGDDGKPGDGTKSGKHRDHEDGTTQHDKGRTGSDASAVKPEKPRSASVASSAGADGSGAEG